MRRVFFLFCVLLSLAWQATAVAGPMAHGTAGGNLEHAVLHWQEAGHHHHDDGSFHQDDSDESATHVALDSALGSPALWMSADLSVPQAQALPPPSSEPGAVPALVLDGLRRPPKSDL